MLRRLALCALATGEILAAAPASPVPSASPECGILLGIVDDSNPDRYSVEDGQFFVTAEVMPNEEGYLPPEIPGQRSLDILLHLKNGQGRSILRGKEQFERVLAHFAGKFDQIRGTWIAPATEADLSDNLETLNALTRGPEGLPPEVAATRTWTGQRAAEAGYTWVVVKELTGSPGNYAQVILFFRKP